MPRVDFEEGAYTAEDQLERFERAYEGFTSMMRGSRHPMTQSFPTQARNRS